MPMQVCAGAILQCSFGLGLSTLIVTPENKVLTTTPAANIMDHIPLKNIPSFVVCTSLSNPAVAAATAATTAAAGGVPPPSPTPWPCMPATTSPWINGAPTVLIGNLPALNNTSKLMCSYGGVITIKSPGQTSVQIP